MRSLRVRFTILGLMLAVAVVALLLTLAVRMHPQPVRVTILGPKGYVITWSDGSKTNLGPDADLPRCNGGEPFAFGFLRRVEWYDRTWSRLTSYTWHTSWPSEQIQDLYIMLSPYLWGFLRFVTHANVIFIIFNVLLWALVFQKIAERRVEA